jgi:phage shock protein C
MSENVKRLYRSRDERWLAGVCGGLGSYFDLDPTLIRALFVLFGLVVGGGLLLYIILWIIIPLEPDPAALQIEEAAAREDESAT